MIDLTGKVALVTGASSGIGHATARTMTEAGATVWTAQRTSGEFPCVEADFSDPSAQNGPSPR